MSTNMQNLHVKAPAATPTPKKSGGGLGMNLSSGMEAAVTAALGLLEQVLCKISFQELRQTQQMATANQMASENSATNIKDGGTEQFIDALAQGIGGIGGSVMSLGAMGIGELRDPSRPELEQIKQEETGVHNYQKALPKTFKPSVNEAAGLDDQPVHGPQTSEEAEATQAKEDHAQRVTDKTQALKKQKSFIDEKGQALKVSERKTSGQTETEQDLISAMDKKQATEVNEALEKRLDSLAERKQGIANKQSSRRQTFATIGQSLGQVSSGLGTGVGAFAKEAQAEDQAEAQLSNSASQGMQSIMGQLLKTANDALAQAQQTIQTFAAISNGNKFQG